MNKLKNISIIVLGTLSVLGTTAFASTGTVNAPNGLVLREKAEKGSNPITTVNDKETVEIEEKDGEWYKVKYGNYEGYMFAEYVNEKEETPDKQTEVITQEEPAEAQTEGTEKKINSSLKIYKIPSITSKIIANIEKDENITVNYELNDWINISSNGITGWARKYFIVDQNSQENNAKEGNNEKQEENTIKEDNTTFEERKGYIDVSSSANIREEASTSANIIDTLLRNTQVTIVGEQGEFYKIKYQDITGYISKSLISDKPLENIATSRSTMSRNIEENIDKKIEEEETKKEEAKNFEKGKAIAEYANKYLGYNYVYGGTTPSEGFDCTGFAFYIYNACGYNLSRSCSAQCQSGTEVEKENLQAGDLLLFCNGANGSVGHVGIYLGDGQFIHAANPDSGVKIDTINSGYYLKYYYQGRRIVK